MIIGYGICGPNESKRYMEKTLQEFARLCDEVIILGNNIGENERVLIAKYGFKLVEDDREWGKYQWQLKQDFLKQHVSKIAKEKDMLVCLDMDEVFCPHLTKEWIQNAELDAYHVFVTELWNDDKHYKAESSFWNVRIWRWNGDIRFKQKPVHCGLAPEWTYFYHRFAPFVLKHYGLMKKEDRQAKIIRYEKYDPNAQFLEKKFYDMLKSDRASDFNEEVICKKIEKEVSDYKQTRPQYRELKPRVRYAYIKNSFGKIIDIPENDLPETLKRKSFSFIGWVDEKLGSVDDIVPVKADPLLCAICGHLAKSDLEIKKHKKIHK